MFAHVNSVKVFLLYLGYRRRPRPLLLQGLCDVFPAPINSLVCWFLKLCLTLSGALLSVHELPGRLGVKY